MPPSAAAAEADTAVGRSGAAAWSRSACSWPRFVIAWVAVASVGGKRQGQPPPPTVAAPPKPFRIVFPEGFTREQMAARVTAVAQIAQRERGKHVRLKAKTYLAATANPRRQPGFGTKALSARGLPLSGDLRLHRARRPRRSWSPRS